MSVPKGTIPKLCPIPNPNPCLQNKSKLSLRKMQVLFEQGNFELGNKRWDESFELFRQCLEITTKCKLEVK